MDLTQVIVSLAATILLVATPSSAQKYYYTYEVDPNRQPPSSQTSALFDQSQYTFVPPSEIQHTPAKPRTVQVQRVQYLDNPPPPDNKRAQVIVGQPHQLPPTTTLPQHYITASRQATVPTQQPPSYANENLYVPTAYQVAQEPRQPGTTVIQRANPPGTTVQYVHQYTVPKQPVQAIYSVGEYPVQYTPNAERRRHTVVKQTPAITTAVVQRPVTFTPSIYTIQNRASHVEANPRLYKVPSYQPPATPKTTSITAPHSAYKSFIESNGRSLSTRQAAVSRPIARRQQSDANYAISSARSRSRYQERPVSQPVQYQPQQRQVVPVQYQQVLRPVSQYNGQPISQPQYQQVSQQHYQPQPENRPSQYGQQQPVSQVQYQDEQPVNQIQYQQQPISHVQYEDQPVSQVQAQIQEQPAQYVDSQPVDYYQGQQYSTPDASQQPQHSQSTYRQRPVTSSAPAQQQVVYVDRVPRRPTAATVNDYQSYQRVPQRRPRVQQAGRSTSRPNRQRSRPKNVVTLPPPVPVDPPPVYRPSATPAPRPRETTTYRPAQLAVGSLPADTDNDGIPGQAGVDYPTLHSVPATSFSCGKQPLGGYYADLETSCQAVHICQNGGIQDSFLCPNGTIWNQEKFACQWWYEVNCAGAAQYYALNENLYKVPTRSPDIRASSRKRVRKHQK